MPAQVNQTTLLEPRPARACTRCVMDTTDPDIYFDDSGVCNHCHYYDMIVRTQVFSGRQAEDKLAGLVTAIKRSGEGRDHDCIIGVSGGVDSTYVAYALKRKLGLRPLAVHLDNGWDSELSVKNIENALKILEIPLITIVLDWNEFRDLQLAFLRASTPDSEIPSDHAIWASIYRVARQRGTRYVIFGCNARTESHLPVAWSQGYDDWRYIYSVHRAFGRLPLKTYPHRNYFLQLWDRYRFQWVNILNYLDYRKTDALAILEKELGWRYYGGKHYESIYTRFYQGYILPKKFGFDKRKTHLSSLICSGEKTRDEALAELAKPTYPEDLQASDREYVIKKLGITETDFDSIMNAPPKLFFDYPSYANARFFISARRILRQARQWVRPT